MKMEKQFFQVKVAIETIVMMVHKETSMMPLRKSAKQLASRLVNLKKINYIFFLTKVTLPLDLLRSESLVVLRYR